jgi:hypothetical protein
VIHWYAVLASAACVATALSCALLINHMPPWRRWTEKLVLSAIALGAAGVAVGPLCDSFDPSFSETLLYVGTGLFAVWLTAPYWCELPLLSRRRRKCPVAHDRRCQP